VAVLTLAVLAISFTQQANCHGGDFGGDFEEGCTCGKATLSRRSNPCYHNASTYQLGCFGTNQYLQCSNRNCSNQTCPTNQVWNLTQGACAACSTGYHVKADGQRCVCNEGTTFNYSSRACAPCPTGATQLADNCTCPNTTVLDRRTNACRPCPANSIKTREGCRCVNNTFWNAEAWACQDCPGQWYNVSVGHRRTVEVCLCNATAQQIFYLPTVSCFTCPTGTTASRDNSVCLCSIRGQWFNYATGQCECQPEFQPNSAGNRCVWSGAATTQIPASP